MNNIFQVGLFCLVSKWSRNENITGEANKIKGLLNINILSAAEVT